MFGLGLPEIIVILIVALLVVGPSKLPDLAKSLGKAFNDFKRMADEVKETIEEAVVKEETPKEGPAKEEDHKEETIQTEAAKEGVSDEGSPGVETAGAGLSSEHEMYGHYSGTEEPLKTAEAKVTVKEGATGGQEKLNETKTKEV
jgi:Tat protein translocase TatB subunit